VSLCNPNQEYQTSISKNQNFIFGEIFYLIFMDLYDNSLKNIGDEFFNLGRLWEVTLEIMHSKTVGIIGIRKSKSTY